MKKKCCEWCSPEMGVTCKKTEEYCACHAPTQPESKGWIEELRTMAAFNSILSKESAEQIIKILTGEIEASYEHGRGQRENITTMRLKAYEQGRLDVIDEIQEIIKNSRTIEEQFGVGIREDTARTQVLVDLLTGMRKEI